MDKFNFLEAQLGKLREQNLLRQLRCIESGPSNDKIIFCSNNYINLADDPRIADAVTISVQQFGCSSTGSRLITGTMKPHIDVEKAFANFFGTENALLFNSGWCANEALIRTLPKKGDLVIIDKLDHASIIDAVKSCDADFKTYRQGQTEKIEKLLADTKYKNKFIITESVFSMDGNTAEIKTLVEMKNKYNAILIVDEAHAVGCMGKTGAGLCQEMGLLDEIDIIVAPLGKAFAANGAIIAAKQVVIDYLINKARAFIYTTALAPATCGAILAGLDIIETEPERRKKLAENARYMRDKLTKAGLNIGNSATHIIPVIIGDAEKTLTISQKLFAAGMFVSAIRPPTVQPGTSRLRISIQTNHTKEQMDKLIEILQAICVSDTIL